MKNGKKIRMCRVCMGLAGGGGHFPGLGEKCMSSKVLEICLTQAIKFSEFMLQVLFVGGKVNWIWNLGNERFWGEILSPGKLNLSLGKVFEICFRKTVQTLNACLENTDFTGHLDLIKFFMQTDTHRIVISPFQWNFLINRN